MKKRWTKREDKILLDAIKSNPTNLAKTFREVGDKLGRTAIAARSRWYYVLNNPENPKYAGTCFTLLCRRMELRNNKISTDYTKHSRTNKLLNTTWRKIKQLLKH